MGFRTVEINKSSEIHIKNNQLIVETNDKKIQIPIEDINQITTQGGKY